MATQAERRGYGVEVTYAQVARIGLQNGMSNVDVGEELMKRYPNISNAEIDQAITAGMQMSQGGFALSNARGEDSLSQSVAYSPGNTGRAYLVASVRIRGKDGVDEWRSVTAEFDRQSSVAEVRAELERIAQQYIAYGSASPNPADQTSTIVEIIPVAVMGI